MKMNVSDQNTTKQDIPDELDRTIATILLQEPSITDKNLGMRLGISRQAVNRRRRSVCVTSLIQKHFEYTSKDIRRLLNKSFGVVETCLDHSDERVRLAAALPLIKIASSELRIAIDEKNSISKEIEFKISWEDQIDTPPSN